MAIDYTYTITQLEMAPSLYGLPDVVTRVRFTYVGVDDANGYSGSFQGACPVAPPDSGSFVPLADLTEDEVIQWVIASHQTEHMNEQILKQINLQITPKYEPVPLPWDPTPPAPSGSI